MPHFALIALLCMVSFGCSSTDSSTQQNRPMTDPAQLEGAWEMVENQVTGQVIRPVTPQQMKIFHDGFFSFVMYGSDGGFVHAGAGTYSVEGNRYTETFRYYSDTTWVGYTDEQTWELRGDTLIFSGFKKVFDRTGKLMPANAWGGDRFVEKRVRAKP